MASECVQHCSMVKDYFGLVTDVPHILFELTLEAVTGLLLYKPARWFLARYRERIHREIDTEHGVIHSSEETGK